MQIEKGDIIAVHGESFLDIGIEAVSHSPISHVAIVVDENRVVEAQGFRDVGYANLSTYKGNSLILRSPGLTKEQQNGIVDYAIKQFGKPYDYTEILHQFERYVFADPDNHSEHGKFICSTLVNEAYKSVGITLVDVPLPSPDDIYKSEKTDIVGRY